ncbi:MAG: hypothetical protein LAO30_22965 [Acidobacteriia bacterium]|nr:hypothetical protein [Terriglobia bacterium]
MFRIVALYRSHPTSNFLSSVPARNLADAARHVHSVTFADLVTVHSTIAELAKVVVDLRPDLLFFFATGGIPIVFPLMKYAAEELDCSQQDGLFHMFPGLAWGGTINGHSSFDYFQAEAVNLIQTRLISKPILRIALIDTTNTGNAINCAVQAIGAALSRAKVKQGEVHIIGVVNASGNAKSRDNENRIPVVHHGGTEVAVSVPAGYEPGGKLESGAFVKFIPTGSEATMPAGTVLNVGYWVVNELFTEDNAELLGTTVMQDALKVNSTGAAGRLEIKFDNGQTRTVSSVVPIGRFLLYLLESRTARKLWHALHAINSMPASQTSKSGTDLDADAALSITEMEHCAPDTLKTLLRINARLTPVQINWLATQKPIPASAIGKVAGALRKSDPEQSETDAQTVIEAANFLGQVFPQHAVVGNNMRRLRDRRQFWLDVYDRNDK